MIIIKDSDNHCKTYKNFVQFPSEEIARKCTVSTDPWANHPKNPPIGKPGETSPFCAMNKYKMYIKNLEK